ncbi:hypothetical protein C9994_15785 [Marivirga lumbricoides]|uniref:D-isomer specific 2-hydroxyacid dehydrogenase NAD-binding domain-containing protein n=1 Tax=Marivirga lumbricoides TaxID=1046115 RepID=A0A2T4DC53_9BACT|nr:hypothetical protein C9994_15785 [Marivirga lumbricoides]
MDKEFPEIKCVRAESPQEIKDLLPTANYVGGFNFLNGYEIDHIEWIHSFGAGVDSFMQISIPENCLLSKTTGKMGIRMGEYCLTYILEDLKQVDKIHTNQQKKVWDQLKQSSLRHQEVYFLGTGYVGTEIAKILKPLSKKLIGINSRGNENAIFDQSIAFDSINPDSITAGSIIINSLPLTDKTEKLVNKGFLQHLKNCLFINVGRGGTVDHEALLVALDQGHIRKAVLDVFEEEPLNKESSLWIHPKCFITPHLAGITDIFDVTESFKMAFEQLNHADKSNQFIQKKRQY